MIKKLIRKFGPNPLDSILRKAVKNEHKTFLVFWNRGLGDIPLGLYAIIHRIKAYIPDAKITFVTRENLQDGFTLLSEGDAIVIDSLKRGESFEKISSFPVEGYDVVLENPNPTQWVSWQHGHLIPRLKWQGQWDELWKKYDLDPNTQYVGAHVQTETNYANWRNWPVESWTSLFEKIVKSGKKVLLFGFEQDPKYEIEGVIDLRGKTPLFHLLSIVKNRCSALIVPDSGVSSMVYYLDEDFPIKHISLWADPYMGILKQNVASPNPSLEHIPLIGKEKNIANITPEEVYAKIH